MGIRIAIKIYNTEKLLKNLKDWGANDESLLMDILKTCGTFTEAEYILLNNEYYEEYNPAYRIHELLESAFKKKCL